MKQPVWFHAANFWQTFNSFCCFPSQHIYLCNVTRSREGVRLRRGKRRKNCFTGCQPLRTCCYYTKDVQKANVLHRSKCYKQTHAHTYTHARACADALHPKNNCRKRKLPFERRKPIIKVLIHKQRLPSEIVFSSWGKEGGRKVF